MKTIHLKAKSSYGDYYLVVFEIAETIKVSCNCKAGLFSKLCRHKTGLLSGDSSFLYDLAEEPKLDELMTFVKISEYSNLRKELISAKNDVDSAKRKEKKIKNTIELFLKEGIPMRVLN